MTLRFRAWIALVIPPVTWFAFEQGLSALLHADCTQAGAGLLWGLGSLILCGVALRLGWRFRARASILADVWLARLALGVAALFALAIAFQTLATLMVPPCVA